MPHAPPNVLITGTSSGIGLALLKTLVNSPQPYHIIATARAKSLSKLYEHGIVENELIHLRPLDVTQRDERVALIEEIDRKWDGVDILVNNAGIAYRSVVEHLAEEDVRLQFRTNLFGPLHLARLCLPSMRAKHAGRIINVSSVGGMMAMPTMGLYSASKFALEGISEALYYEMRPWGVHVSLIQPGFVRSKSFKNVYASQAARDAVQNTDTYANYYWHMGRFIEKLMIRAQATPESIARKIEKLMQAKNPPLRVPASFDAHLFSLITRFLPRRFYHWLLYRQLPGIQDWGTGNRQALQDNEQVVDIPPNENSER